jgi:hypothetical protein
MDVVERLAPLSLRDLEERAALLRRTDRKYVLDRAVFDALVERLAGDHDVLEIDGRRVFAYSSMYVDSPDLRCFHDHAAGRAPRFKARTRHYRDTGVCHFEVKLKLESGETDKRQIDHAPSDDGVLTEEARRLVDETLPEAGIEPPAELRPALRTGFHRVTFASRTGRARLTSDLGVAMEALDGRSTRMREGRVLVESKSEDGWAAADRVLADLGQQSLALSKYRTGIDLLVERDETGDLDAIRPLFTPPA